MYTRTADEVRSIDLADLSRWGYLKQWQKTRSTVSWQNARKSAVIEIHMGKFDAHMMLEYEYYGELLRYRVNMTHTPCQYGARRWWFRCPLCASRVRILYGPDRYFGCRKCYHLWYTSQRNDRLFGLWDRLKKADFLEERIKRKWYAGQPTRQYRRVLKLTGMQS